MSENIEESAYQGHLWSPANNLFEGFHLPTMRYSMVHALRTYCRGMWNSLSLAYEEGYIPRKLSAKRLEDKHSLYCKFSPSIFTELNINWNLFTCISLQ